MYFFKRKKQQLLVQRSISLIILIALCVNILPQSVQAKSKSSPAIVYFHLQAADNRLLAVHVRKLPISNERIAVRSITVIATAYESVPGQTDNSPCIPAMSTFNLCTFYQHHGYGDTIAANFLPLGTKVRFPSLYGDKVFTVRDRMNFRYHYGRVDFWMHTGARHFGVKRMQMEIL